MGFLNTHFIPLQNEPSPIVAGAIAGEITSVIYLRFVLANRIYVEAQRILLCGKSKNSHCYYFNKLKPAKIKMTLKNKP